MKEYFTPAIILSSGNGNGNDRLYHLFSREIGRVRVKAVGALKSSSKLAPHLDALNLVDLRLVRKGNGFVVTDALLSDRFKRLRKESGIFARALNVIFLLKVLLPENETDLKLWYEVLRQFNEACPDSARILGIMGYASDFAICGACRCGDVSHFYHKDQSFFCNKCSSNFLEKHLVQVL